MKKKIYLAAEKISTYLMLIYLPRDEVSDITTASKFTRSFQTYGNLNFINKISNTGASNYVLSFFLRAKC